MNSQIIVSRFDENLEWLLKWKNEFNIVVYNKGEIINDDNFNYVNLPNYGREAHTYLYHIVENYDKLYENNVFLQGKISDIICAYQNLMQYIVEIENNGYSANCLGYNFDPPLWNDIDFIADPKYKEQVETKFFKLSDIKFRDYVKKYLGKIPKSSPISMNGCFGVRKDFILSRPKQFYVNLFESIPNYHTPEEAHFLERMWAYIFTEKKWNY